MNKLTPKQALELRTEQYLKEHPDTIDVIDEYPDDIIDVEDEYPDDIVDAEDEYPDDIVDAEDD